MRTKVGRRVSEMEEIAKAFGDLALTLKIRQGVAAIYRFVGSSSMVEETPETRHRDRTPPQVLEALAAHFCFTR
jgi:Domain of unknown function (DUF1932)